MMIEFWLAIGLSLALVIFYVWFSVVQANRQPVELYQSHSTENKTTDNYKSGVFSPSLIILFCLLALSPFLYLQRGNIEKQEEWKTSTNKLELTSNNINGDLSGGKIGDTLLALRSLIDQDPNNAQLWFILAESYFQLQQVDLADAAIQKALQLDPKPQWFVANAQILSLRGSDQDLSRSIRLLRQALALEPNHQSALLTLGFVHLKREEYAVSIQYWEKLARILEKAGHNPQRIRDQIAFARSKLK